MCIDIELMFAHIRAGEKKQKKVVFDEEPGGSDVLAVYDSVYELNDEGYPNMVELIYFDIDNNLTTVDYTRHPIADGFYFERGEPQY